MYLGVLYSPLQSAVQIKYLFSSAWFSFLLKFATQEKKANQQLHLNEAVLQRCNIPDCMFLSCHVRVSEWIHAQYLPDCQGSLC